MNLINKKVIHKKFGKGIIIGIDGDRIEVSFDNGKVSKFKFPDAFKMYIIFDDPILQKSTEDEINRNDEIR